MLTTFDRTQWHEDRLEQLGRESISSQTPESEVRSFYPYKVRITKACKVYGFKTGDVVNYARTRHDVQFFPIEALIFERGQTVRKVFMGSEEGQLFEE